METLDVSESFIVAPCNSKEESTASTSVAIMPKNFGTSRHAEERHDVGSPVVSTVQSRRAEEAEHEGS